MGARGLRRRFRSGGGVSDGAAGAERCSDLGLAAVILEEGLQVRLEEADVSGALDADDGAGFPPVIEGAGSNPEEAGGFGFIQEDSGGSAGPAIGLGCGVHPSP